MENKYQDLLKKTELIELKNIEKEFGLNAKIFLKLEYQNPSGSIKDRPALYMLLDALDSGKIKPGATVIEATSGNTGIGLAYFAAKLGLKAVIVMPDSMSLERRALMQKYGAELILTPGAEGMGGAVKKAAEIEKNTENSFIAAQFDNPVNPLSHYLTTGVEILEQTAGKVDIFVAGIGTGGTVSGVGRRLKEADKTIAVVGVEPSSSPLLTKGYAAAHKIQGIGANFIPKALDRSILNETLSVADEEAFEFRRLLFACEGLNTGISAGANVAAAVKLAKRRENRGKIIVTVAPDGADRYPGI